MKPMDSHSPAAHDDAMWLEQAKAVLTPMPAVDRRRIAAIMAATHDRKRTRTQRFVQRLTDVLTPAVTWWRHRVPPLARIGTAAALVLMLGVAVRSAWQPSAPSGTTVTTASSDAATSEPASASAPALQSASDAAHAADRRVTTQFVLDARDVPSARSVSVVGDFNEWSTVAAPLVLENGVWTTTMPLPQGRHAYAFVVNDTQWIADPRAPRAKDDDFGRPGSVIIVRQP